MKRHSSCVMRHMIVPSTEQKHDQQVLVQPLLPLISCMMHALENGRRCWFDFKPLIWCVSNLFYPPPLLHTLGSVKGAKSPLVPGLGVHLHIAKWYQESSVVWRMQISLVQIFLSLSFVLSLIFTHLQSRRHTDGVAPTVRPIPSTLELGSVVVEEACRRQ
jgi:hypothetical protein